MEEFSYIVLDLEWNQPMPGQETITQPFRFDSEIIEIGALKLNSRFEKVSEFKSFVRPVFYPAMNGHVVQLTKIRPQELEKAPDFPEGGLCRLPGLVRRGLLPVYLGAG